MVERKAFLLRLDPRVHDALQRWAASDLRSLNAQIEYLLRRALVETNRFPGEPASPGKAVDSANERDPSREE